MEAFPFKKVVLVYYKSCDGNNQGI